MCTVYIVEKYSVLHLLPTPRSAPGKPFTRQNKYHPNHGKGWDVQGSGLVRETLLREKPAKIGPKIISLKKDYNLL